MERETPIECSFSTYSKSVQFALDNKELIEEATFIVFIYYFLRKRPSFQGYIKSLNSEKLLARIGGVFGKAKAYNVHLYFPGLLIPKYECQDLFYSSMYKHYFTTESIVEKWHMKMVIDNYLIKDWINEYKKNKKESEIDSIDKFWNKKFENFWNKDIMNGNIEDVTYEKELIEEVYLNTKNHALEKLKNPTYLHIAMVEFTNKLKQNTKKKGGKYKKETPIAINHKMHLQKLISLVVDLDYSLEEVILEQIKQNILAILEYNHRDSDKVNYLTNIRGEEFNTILDGKINEKTNQNINKLKDLIKKAFEGSDNDKDKEKLKEENIEKSLKINKGITINENANIEASKEISLKEKGNISLKGKEKLNENKIIQIKPDEKEISSSSKKYDEDFDKNINLQTEIKESKGAKKGVRKMMIRSSQPKFEGKRYSKHIKELQEKQGLKEEK
uniref:Uncharacterized protein n=1 Tax=Meloidogyne enterolobii TaxID=390850 RepID=A0A6V7X334_MELEN|nr:unnamed protein product [Meloidogyne enterolobii]